VSWVVHFTLTDCFGVKHCAFSYFMDPTSNRDALREGPVRLLGYANEVGESMKPVVPHAAYLASYGVAGLYVLGDAAWRGTRPPVGESGVVEALDTLLWQGLASVALPGFAINRVVWAVGHASIGRIAPGNLRTWLPTAAGLACIPFIVKPIDHGVTLLMDRVVRPLYNKKG
jgi:mitochondrial fission process protein 1